jgi:hypothetical protein
MKTFKELLSEAKETKIVTVADLKRAIDSFDDLPQGKKSSEAKKIAKFAEKLGYTLKKKSILELLDSKKENNTKTQSDKILKFNTLGGLVNLSKHNLTALKGIAHNTDCELVRTLLSDVTTEVKYYDNIDDYISTIDVDDLFVSDGHPIYSLDRFMELDVNSREYSYEEIEEIASAIGNKIYNKYFITDDVAQLFDYVGDSFDTNLFVVGANRYCLVNWGELDISLVNIDVLNSEVYTHLNEFTIDVDKHDEVGISISNGPSITSDVLKMREWKKEDIEQITETLWEFYQEWVKQHK